MALSRSYAGFAAVSADAVDILKRICHFECCSSMYDYGVRILCKVDDCYLLNATTSYNAIIINRCRHLEMNNKMFVPFDDFLVGIARLWRVSIAHKEKENGGQGNFQQLVTAALTSEEFYLEVMSSLLLVGRIIITSRKMLLCDDASDDHDDDDQ
ncbi:hypothetical protein GQX74_009096 [Glossina fuscipes]|nr:hypothetical protein GQX74_009096 [Glossina fuscipes]